MGTQSTLAVPQLGELLRHWRQERGNSQLELSMDTDISEFCGKRAKHSQPGLSFHRIRCLEHSSPRTERSVLASGFATQFSEQGIDAERMAVVTRAIDRMLRQHELHPALGTGPVLECDSDQ